MARPKSDEPRATFIKFRTTIAEKVDFHLRAAQEGMKGSDYFRLKCFGSEPSVKFAPPERQAMIKNFQMLKKITDFIEQIRTDDPAHRLRVTSALLGVEVLVDLVKKDLDDN